MTLAAGRAARCRPAQLFGFDPDNPQAGSFIVTSDQPSVFGDLTFGDSSLARLTRPRYRFLRPLRAPRFSLPCERFAASTTLNITESKHSPAAVTLAVFTRWNSSRQRGCDLPAIRLASVRLTTAVPAASISRQLRHTQLDTAGGVIRSGRAGFGRRLRGFRGAGPLPGRQVAVRRQVRPAISVTPTSLDFGSVTTVKRRT